MLRKRFTLSLWVLCHYAAYLGESGRMHSLKACFAFFPRWDWIGAGTFSPDSGTERGNRE